MKSEVCLVDSWGKNERFELVFLIALFVLDDSKKLGRVVFVVTNLSDETKFVNAHDIDPLRNTVVGIQ